jgi:hypothetical protein
MFGEGDETPRKAVETMDRFDTKLPPFAQRVATLLEAALYARTYGEHALAVSLWVNAVDECSGPLEGRHALVQLRAKALCYGVHAYLRGCSYYVAGESRCAV